MVTQISFLICTSIKYNSVSDNGFCTENKTNMVISKVLHKLQFGA